MAQEAMGGQEKSGGGGGGPPTGTAGGDLTGNYPNPTVAAKDGAAGTASMRTLGTGATQACAGNDSRLSDSRAPNGSATGDLTGTYPAPTLAAVVTAATKGGTGKLIKTIQYDAKGRIIVTVVEGVAGVDYQEADLSTRAASIRKGLAASGLTSDYGELWDDFNHAQTTAALGWFPQPTGGGTVTVNGVATTAIGGGIMRLGTSATANSVMEELGLMGLIVPIASTRWYIVARIRVNTAVDAQTIACFGLKNAAVNKTLLMGVNGSSSAVNFTAQYDGNYTGTFASLGIGVDTAFHVFEMWSVGDGKIHTRVDGAGTDINATMAAAPTDYCYPFFTIKNGTTPTDRTMDVDYQLTLYPRV